MSQITGATTGSASLAVVAPGISEALVATALGLGVAIVALAFFNYLQVRMQSVSGTYARACERLVQALIYIETGAAQAEADPEVTHGSLSPA